MSKLKGESEGLSWSKVIQLRFHFSGTQEATICDVLPINASGNVKDEHTQTTECDADFRR